MHTAHENSGAASDQLLKTTTRLREELAFFERRLEQMGHSGDCAYERAMVQVYENQTRSRRQRLAELTGLPLSAA